MAQRKPYTIAYLIDDLSLGGAQKLLSIAASVLPEQYSPIIFCLSQKDKPFGDTFRQANIPVFTFKRNGHLDLPRLIAVKRALAAQRVDLLHSYLHASNVYAYLAGRMLNRPVVLSLQSNKPNSGRFQDFVLSCVFRKADRVTANSTAGRDYLLQTVRMRPDRIALLNNCFPAEMLPAPPSSQTTSTKTIGYVGRLDNNAKRIDLILRAFPLLLTEEPAARLVLVGTGPDEEMLRSLARNLGIAQQVEFRGAVPDVFEVMREYSCLVLPSAFEGLPMVIIEALSLGIPVIASDVGDITDLVLDNVTGRIIRDESPEGLSRLMLEVMNNRALAASTRDRGPALVREKFSVESFRVSITRLYDSLL